MSIICICGDNTKKNEALYKRYELLLSLNNYIVFNYPIFIDYIEYEYTENERKQLNNIHIDKIDMSDMILLFPNCELLPYIIQSGKKVVNVNEINKLIK